MSKNRGENEEGKTNRVGESEEMKSRPSRQEKARKKKKKFLNNGMTVNDKVLEN